MLLWSILLGSRNSAGSTLCYIVFVRLRVSMNTARNKVEIIWIWNDANPNILNYVSFHWLIVKPLKMEFKWNEWNLNFYLFCFYLLYFYLFWKRSFFSFSIETQIYCIQFTERHDVFWINIVKPTSCYLYEKINKLYCGNKIIKCIYFIVVKLLNFGKVPAVCTKLKRWNEKTMRHE